LLFQNSIGIDIQDTRISIVHLKTSLKGILLAGHHTQPLDSATDLSERLKEATRVVDSFLRQNGIKTTEIFIGVPNSLAFQRLVELPAAVAENLLQTMGYELEKYVPLPLESVYLDAQIIAENRKQGLLKALLLVVKKEALDPYISFGQNIAEGAGGVEIRATALASYLTFHSDLAKQQAVAYIVRSSNSYETGLLEDGKLIFSNETSTDTDMADVLKILKAETKQITKDPDGPEKTIHIVAEEGDLASITTEFQSEMGDAQVGTSSLPTRIPPFEYFAAAYGLALKGLQKTAMRINLMPPSLRKKQNKIGYYTIIALSLAVVLMGLLWGGGRVFQHRLQLNRLDDRLSSLGEEVSRIDGLASEIDLLEKQTDGLVSIYQAYTPVLSILNELSDAVPDDSWLDSISISGKKVQITGTAVSASDVLARLEDSQMFHDVAFLSTITKDKEGRDIFRIELKTDE
jgi:general secretion pathway protein L